MGNVMPCIKAKMQILQQDLVKYCKQIGIVDCEIPQLVFYGEDFKAIHVPHKSNTGSLQAKLEEGIQE